MAVQEHGRQDIEATEAVGNIGWKMRHEHAYGDIAHDTFMRWHLVSGQTCI